jgi:toxin ParE1/3/4
VSIVWASPAIADLAEVRAYIGLRHRSAARRIGARILAAVARLQRFPNAGRPGRVAGTRELVVTGTPYLVPYRVNADRIEILRVLHGARKWPSRL